MVKFSVNLSVKIPYNASRAEALELIAREEKSEYIRAAAVKKITDQPLLEYFAMEDHTPLIRREATLKIKNYKLIQKIAISDFDTEVRKAAIGRLDNQSLLRLICLEEDNYEVRDAAIKKLSSANVDILLSLGEGDDSWLCRHSAIWKIKPTDNDLIEGILFRIAKLDPVDEIRKTATIKIKNEEYLFEIANTEKINAIREEAVSRLNSDEYLIRVIENIKHGELSSMATRKLINIDYLRKIVQNNHNRYVREIALKKLTADAIDDTIRSDLAIDDNYSGVREEAVKKLDDQELLFKIVRKSPYLDTCRQAIGKLDEIDRLMMLRLIGKPSIQQSVMNRILALKSVE